MCGRRGVPEVLVAVLGAMLAGACGGASVAGEAADAGASVDAQLPDARPQLDFVVGLSHVSGGIEDIVDELGIGWVRQTIGWDALDPVVEPSGLTLAEARTEAALVAYTDGHDFAELDATIGRFVERDVKVVIGVGSGWNRSIPTVADGRPAGPDVIGREEYLARQVLVTRALVERYDGDGVMDAPGSPRATAWQVENELNEACATSVGSSRYPGGLDALQSAWCDFAFVEQVFDELVRAARTTAPDAIVMTNLHTGVRAEFGTSIGTPPWPEVLVRWRDRLDWIGLDTYPNYIQAMPLGFPEVGEAVRQAVALAETRPVLVIETGYSSGPAILGYDEDRQAMFMREAYSLTRDNGGSGLFWFGTRTSERHSVVIDERDIATLARLGEAYAAGDVRAFINLVLEDQVYFEEHLARVIDAGGAYLGLVREDGSRKPSWSILAAELTR
jgi:hypothetical protein